jgi:hypothetical protein
MPQKTRPILKASGPERVRFVAVARLDGDAGR